MDIKIEKQFVEDVVDFTSQYGSGGSISYTAHNIVGKPRIFPSYGDFPQAFIMRTYGEWWEQAPSGTREICSQNFGTIKSQDYIDLLFENKVYPTAIDIYETYNPGAVVRIWAYDGQEKWVMMWQACPMVIKHTSRIFSPKINSVPFATNMVRLEFDHRHLDYYTELDAVILTGTAHPPAVMKPDDLSMVLESAGEITRRVISLNLHRLPPSSVPSSPNHATSEQSLAQQSSPFNKLPHETVLQIFRVLDLKSLCRCACVCRRFLNIATDASLYLEVNLRPYWSVVSPNCLQSLAVRCERLTALDISWCRGGDHQQFVEAFIRFIEDCGRRLKILRLSNCKFINNKCLQTISKTCSNLEELSLRNVTTPTQDGWNCLSELSQLQHLDLYHTPLNINSIVHVLQHLPHLLHLNLGSCILNPNMDVVADALASFNPKLRSVDMWKTYTLTAVGMRSLARCGNLEEVELGWCGDIDSPGESLQVLAQGCPRLRKLFIAALRGVADRDLLVFLEKCPLLEQVDLLGARNITPDICLRFLTQCPKLKLLDLSFCEQILEAHVRQWSLLFPHVSIKRSYTPVVTNLYP